MEPAWLVSLVVVVYVYVFVQWDEVESVTHWQSTQSLSAYIHWDVDDMGTEDCLSWHGMQGLDTPEFQLKSTAII